MMRLHPLRARRERHEHALRERNAFHTVRQAARDEVRLLARLAGDAPHTLNAARSRIDAATTAEEVVAVEPYVLAARGSLGVPEPEGRRSYQHVLDAARLAPYKQRDDQTVTRVRGQDQAGWWDAG